MITRNQLQPDKDYKPYTADVVEVKGTVERELHCAVVDKVGLSDGELDIDYAGYSEDEYDTETVKRNGQRLWLAEDGRKIDEDQLMFEELI